jgi:alkylation response protein AidB-like acyl-CoA dehydrogenase
MLMDKLQQERLVVAIWAVAAARYIHDWLLENRAVMAVNGRLKQSVQFALVEMATEITIGRTFIENLVAEHMAGQQVIAETSMAKYWTTDMVKRIADRALDFCGRLGTLETCRIARVWRDVRVMSIFAGTNEIMKNIAAKFMGL